MDDRARMLFGDTLVPDIFISDHMAELDGLAVKVYLLALHLGASDEAISVEKIAARLSESASKVQAALVDLDTRQLVRMHREGQSFQIRDIKEVELLKNYRPITSKQPSEINQASPDFEARRQMVQAISQTFFHDMMSPGWYSQIDQWFEDYKFEAEVVYALFQECERRNRLGSRAYAKAVADNWHQNNVRNYQDLERYWASFEKKQGIIALAQKNLKRNQLTLPEEKMVRNWVDELGFDEQMIELAFSKATSATKPSLNYFDTILRNWHRDGLQTPEDVQRSDQRRSQSRKREKRLESILNRSNLTDHDLKTVRHWRDELGFSDDVIEHILKISSVASTHPSISYFDRAIHNYHEQGLHTMEAIDAHEAERRQSQQAGKKSRRAGYSGSRGKSQGSFRERQYDDQHLDSIYQDAWDALLDYAEADPAADQT